ncbi:kelch-like protein 9 [Branchiostoma lanceolatum]|uniref:kelch-like protein 9 n=1 Tax=Branchiostoma lanceolatum TaxID=7740 RepID=UPI0034557158
MDAEAEKLAHCCHVVNNLDAWRRSGVLCDVVLEVGDQTFPAHSVTLASFSGRMKQMFETADEYREVPYHISLDEGRMTFSAMSAILDFMYTSELRITFNNVMEIMGACDELIVPAIIEKCRDFLKTFDLQTCLECLWVTSHYQYWLGGVNKTVRQFVLANFMSVMNTRSFYTQDVTQLESILDDDDLSVPREIDAFLAIFRWIEGEADMRVHFAHRLLGKIRFSYIDPDEFAEAVKYVNSIQSCRKVVLEAFQFYSTQKTVSFTPQRRRGRIRQTTRETYREEAVITPQPVALPRPSRSTVMENTVVIVGGLCETDEAPGVVGARGHMIHKFNRGQNRWELLTTLPASESRDHSAVAVLYDNLYVIGGTNPQRASKEYSPLSTCYRYDPDTDDWADVAAMNNRRTYAQAAALQGVVYVVGGLGDRQRVLGTVEYYNPTLDEWTYAAPLLYPRYAAAVAVHAERLYVAGGRTEPDVVSNVVEMYDPGPDRWEQLPPLRMPRSHAAMSVVQGRLYLVGGVDDKGRSISAIDVLGDDSELWEHVADLSVPRHDMGVATLEPRLFIIGGSSTRDRRMSRTVECLDLEKRAWVTDVAGLTAAASGFGCCSLTVPIRKNVKTLELRQTIPPTTEEEWATTESSASESSATE